MEICASLIILTSVCFNLRTTKRGKTTTTKLQSSTRVHVLISSCARGAQSKEHLALCVHPRYKSHRRHHPKSCLLGTVWRELRLSFQIGLKSEAGGSPIALCSANEKFCMVHETGPPAQHILRSRHSQKCYIVNSQSAPRCLESVAVDFSQLSREAFGVGSSPHHESGVNTAVIQGPLDGTDRHISTLSHK